MCNISHSTLTSFSQEFLLEKALLLFSSENALLNLNVSLKLNSYSERFKHLQECVFWTCTLQVIKQVILSQIIVTT